MQNFNKEQLRDRLKDDDDHERGGFVLDTGEIIEFDNVSPEKTDAFTPDYEVLLPYIPHAVSTWHTHPGMTSNLSPGDWETFCNWPNLTHYIVGTDGVREYRVDRGAVVNV